MRLRSFVLLVILTGGLSCAPKEPVLVPVSGRVRLTDGRPVTTGIVEAIHESGKSTARGKLDAEGRFTLKTGDHEGAQIGKYVVIVQQMIIADGAPNHVGKHTAHLVIHAKYAKPETSGLARSVEPNSKNEWNLELEPAATKRGW